MANFANKCSYLSGAGTSHWVPYNRAGELRGRDKMSSNLLWVFYINEDI